MELARHTTSTVLVNTKKKSLPNGVCRNKCTGVIFNESALLKDAAVNNDYTLSKSICIYLCITIYLHLSMYYHLSASIYVLHHLHITSLVR